MKVVYLWKMLFIKILEFSLFPVNYLEILEFIVYSPFRLTSLIYAEKFEFENNAIMEDKQCKGSD